MKSKLLLLLALASFSAPAFATPVLINGTFSDTSGTPWYTTGGVSLDTYTLSSTALVGFTSVFGATSGTVEQAFVTAAAGTLDYSLSLSRSEAFGPFNDVGLAFALVIDGILVDDTLPNWGNPSGIHPTAVTTWTDYSGSVALDAGAHVFSLHFARADTLFGRAPFFEIQRVTGEFTSSVAGVPEAGSTIVFAGMGCVLLGMFRAARLRLAPRAGR
ncbi:MAG TPA: hypothetical protein VG734_21335 [Lacunisphaera sp.]|nr:hypothetical protein [Lacunisphaera sp.]